MSRNYTVSVVKTYSTSDPATTIEFQAGTLNSGVLSVEVPGRGAPGYGQAYANTVSRIISNGSAQTIPASPLVGQLWYDRQSHRLMSYVGTGATEATSSLYPGWLYIPATSSSAKDGIATDLGAVKKSGDSIVFLNVDQAFSVTGASTFCGSAEFHDRVVFRANTPHNGINHPNAKVEFGSNVEILATSTLTVNGNSVFNSPITVNSSGSLTVAGAATFGGTTTLNGSVAMTSQAVTSTGKIVVDNTAASPAILEIGTNGILNIKGQMIVVGDLVSSSSMNFSVDAAVKPVASGTLPVLAKTFNRIIPNTAVTNATGKVRLPAASLGTMIMCANDTSYGVTLTRYNTTDTVDNVVEDILIGPGARMQLIAWAATSSKVDWALMGAFYS